MTTPRRAGGDPRGTRRLAAATCALGLGLVTLVGGCARGGEEAAHGVLVVAIDGLRADHVSSLGYDRETTPTLDALAREGAAFAQAFTTAPRMIPAHLSLLTGSDPSVCRRVLPEGLELPETARWRASPRVPALAVELLVGGYATGAFVDDQALLRVEGLQRGFQLLRCLEDDGRSGPRDDGAEWLTKELRQWVAGLDRDRPWFAYLHLRDLVRGFLRPEPQWDSFFPPREELSSIPPVGKSDDVFFALPRSLWRSENQTLGAYEARYDGAILRLDSKLDELFQSLELSGRWRDTTVVVVGAHGLEFGEGGLLLGHGMLKVADLHVPWIVRPAARHALAPATDAVRVVESLASTADLAPTLLELCGLELPARMHGVSQLGTLRGQAPPQRAYVHASCGLAMGYAVFGERWATELLRPSTFRSAARVRSWFGQNEPPHEDDIEIFYDRLAQPHPPLSARPRAPEEVERELRAEALSWTSRMIEDRREVQTSAWAERGAARTGVELVERAGSGAPDGATE